MFRATKTVLPGKAKVGNDSIPFNFNNVAQCTKRDLPLGPTLFINPLHVGVSHSAA